MADPEYTGQMLMAEKIDPPKFFIENVLPEGLSLIVAPGKTGKSFLVTQLSAAIATGSLVLHRIPTLQSEVLYLDLENNKAKAQARWAKQLQGQPMPAGIHPRFSWPRMDDPKDPGLAKMARFLDTHPRVGVVFVDVYSRFAPTQAVRGMNAYHAEYKILSEIKTVADERRIAICFVHHDNKTNPDDPLASISGTNAMGGVPDAVWMLSRAREKSFGRLYITGRAANECAFHLAWSKVTLSWEIVSEDS